MGAPLDTEERREYNALLHDLVAQHNESIVKLNDSITLLMDNLQEQETKNALCRQQLADVVPDGDHDGHRRWHEAEIQRMESRAALWSDVQKSVAKWGVIGIVTWMGYAVWHEVLAMVARR